MHRLVHVIENSLEEKKVCSAVFLEVSKAIDKVWHEGLNFKIKKMLPMKISKILSSYLSSRFFRIRQDDAYSDLKGICAGVPQGSVLGPILYLLYTSDMPEEDENTIATFADDTAFLATGDNTQETSLKLNNTLSKFERWTHKWRIKLNEDKSVHVDFTYRNLPYAPLYLNNTVIPFSNQAKYLGMNLDTKLKWKVHVKKKREQLQLKYQRIYWLIGRYSSLPIENKLLVYKQVIRPIFTYGAELWGTTCETNIQIIQRFQNKVLRSIVNAPWYIRNNNLHRDLCIETVKEVIRKAALAHQQRLEDHENVECAHLLDIEHLIRRLKRTKVHEVAERHTSL